MTDQSIRTWTKSLTALITPPARRAWRGYKSASLNSSVFFFGVESWVADSCVIPLCNAVRAHVTTTFKLNFQQNTQFNMDTIASKQQEGFTFKNSHPKCFITTNSIARLSPGAVNRGEVFRACFRNFQLCFHLNFYTLIKLIFYTKLHKTHFLTRR